MSTLDKNKIFFGLIHYILSEQKNVNWLIKNSLIDITGVNSLLEEKPYKTDSILDDVIDYITEIKPYHVQFSHYFEHYQSTKEIVNIPKNDTLKQTIGLTLDAIKSVPDINFIFNEYVETLPSASDIKINGYTVFNKEDYKFYELKNNSETKEYEWIELDINLSYDGYYFSTNPKNFYVVKENEQNYDTLIKAYNNDNEKETFLKDFVNKHKANRLFYIKYWVRNNDNDGSGTWKTGGIENFEEIKKELNANFKGLEISGSVFDIEKFGYDIFNYDTTDYDSPTVIYDYYFINYYDDNFKPTTTMDELVDNFNILDENYYQILFVNSGEHRFSLGSNYHPDENNFKVYKVYSNGEIERNYTDFEINGNYIDVFTPLKDKEKIYVLNKTIEEKIKYAYVIDSNSFSVSDSDVIKRKYVFLDKDVVDNWYYLNIPTPDVGNNDKIAIQIKTKYGSKPFNNFELLNNQIKVSNIEEYNHIIMTKFDYKYLYDKIYTWEDRYGRSNNIVNLNGDNFLRALYEEDRPSEKIVSYPQNTLFIYKKVDNAPDYILMNDYKNDMTYTNIGSNYGEYLYKKPPERDINGMITSFYIENISNFSNPSGYAIINSEIFEYKDIKKHPDENEEEKYYYELTNLSRALYGTPISDINDNNYENYKIIPYNKKRWNKEERNNLYKTYNCKGNNITKYACPSGYKLYSLLNQSNNGNITDGITTDRIIVTKLPKIILKEDVTIESNEIIINSCNIVSNSIQNILKSGTKYEADDYLYLRINDDTVKFKNIEKYGNDYKLSGIILPEKYKNYKKSDIIYDAKSSFIHSCLPQEIENYSIIIEEGDDFDYDIVEINDSNDDSYDYSVIMSNGVERYKIDGEKIYEIINSPSIEDPDDTDEVLFGYIKENYVYKTDGSIFAKIDSNKFKSIQVYVNLPHNELIYKESLHINVLN